MTARSQPNDYWCIVAESLVAQRKSTSVMCVVEMFDGNDVDVLEYMGYWPARN